MRRFAASLAIALSALGTPTAARATSDSGYFGTCSFNTFAQETVTGHQDRFVGEVRTLTFLYSNSDGTVVNATVTCEVRVNGVVVTSASRWGSGVVAFVAPVSFTATDVDDVRFCTVVDFTSDDTPTATYCPGATTLEAPPQAWADFVNGTSTWLNGPIVSYVDPALCTALALLAPGADPVTIDHTGDVFLMGELFWDCPPYEWGQEPWPPAGTPLPPTPPGTPQPPRDFAGAAYDTGDAGFRALVSPDRDVTSTCAFVADRANGTVTVLGSTATAGADVASIRCRLEDTATGAVLYDETAGADTAFATLHDTLAATPGAITVCTQGTGSWGTREVTVELDCRPGEPLS